MILTNIIQILSIASIYRSMQVILPVAKTLFIFIILIIMILTLILFNVMTIYHCYKDINLYIDVIIYMKIYDLKTKILHPMIKKSISKIQRISEKFQIYKMAFFIWIINEKDFQTVTSLLNTEDPNLKILKTCTTKLKAHYQGKLIGLPHTSIEAMTKLVEPELYLGHPLILKQKFSDLNYLNNQFRRPNTNFYFTNAHITNTKDNSTDLLNALNMVQIRNKKLDYSLVPLEYQEIFDKCQQTSIQYYVSNKEQWHNLESVINNTPFLRPIHYEITQYTITHFLPSLTFDIEHTYPLCEKTKGSLIAIYQHIFDYNQYIIKHNFFPLINSPIYTNARNIDNTIMFTNIGDKTINYYPYHCKLLYHHYSPWNPFRLYSYPPSHPLISRQPVDLSYSQVPLDNTSSNIQISNPIDTEVLNGVNGLVETNYELIMKGIAASISGTLGC